MIAVDTNVVVRLLTKDDEDQYRAAYDLFKRQRIYIPTTVILETEWVLRFAYEFDAGEIQQALHLLFGLPNVELEDPLPVAEALAWHAQGMDFADALHLAVSRGADGFVTFDKRLTARATELVDLPVSVP